MSVVESAKSGHCVPRADERAESLVRKAERIMQDPEAHVTDCAKRAGLNIADAQAFPVAIAYLQEDTPEDQDARKGFLDGIIELGFDGKAPEHLLEGNPDRRFVVASSAGCVLLEEVMRGDANEVWGAQYWIERF